MLGTDESSQGLPELPTTPNGRTAVVHCRAGFEREAEEELAGQAAAGGIRGTTEARPGLALFTPAPPVAFARIAAALRYADLIFARQLLFSSALCAGLVVGDRVAPLVAAARAQANRYGEIVIETADTEASKPLLPLCRGLASPLRQAVRSAGLLGHAPVDPAWPRLHIIFLRSDSAVVGLSYPGNSSPWPMGIPRLRATRGAPSRAGLKLEEAFLTLLTAGEREERLR
ncbi:MAG: 23S rRNA (cytidine(2498)-2'-O)-methyltransferase RlmM, partial [Gammaproteobacteria bacterium]